MKDWEKELHTPWSKLSWKLCEHGMPMTGKRKADVEHPGANSQCSPIWETSCLGGIFNISVLVVSRE